MSENYATSSIEQQAFKELIEGQYSQASNLYQQAIETRPDLKSNYWYLGLSLLLQGQEVEAQVTWMLVLGEGDEEQVEQWTKELIEILETEANRREENEENANAWLIRQHIREINPGHLSNLLKLMQLSLKERMFSGEKLTEWQVIERLESGAKARVDNNLLLETLSNLLDEAPLEPLVVDFVKACLPHVENPQLFVNVLIPKCLNISQSLREPGIAMALTEISINLMPENPEIWRHLASYCQDNQEYNRGVEAAKKAYSLQHTLFDKLFSNYLAIRGLMGAGGRWQEALEARDQHEDILKLILEKKEILSSFLNCCRMYTTAYFFPYFRDDLKKNREIHNQVAKFCQTSIEFHEKEVVDKYRQRIRSIPVSTATRKSLRIGYISHCFSQHSVGWLARWLFKYRDREKYQTYGYFINYRFHARDELQELFVNNMDYPRKLGINPHEVAEQIYQDEIDILVDLDSITLDIGCGIMALKPAPIQVTWLGWDASGIPTIDYTIADPYVLPDYAQDYYHEKIWRLPQTYIAVDGFEVGVPTLRRDQLELPDDAVLYFSSQRGYKRHPETIRLQLKIIKQVPNSYFLIKGLGDTESIKQFFLDLGKEEGVSEDRLRFLPGTPSEAIHRANLGIADIVLDTYPYNGATTTLETLWMCVPLVTRVGEQFAARNSYTMMVNAGIKEGIAWTDEEYVEWGVRLGEDPILRQQISWKLRQSRQTAPLWNSKQFTRDMENAYEQMWQRYIDSRYPDKIGYTER